jgi:peptide/nickel transport system ATP-binding protein
MTTEPLLRVRELTVRYRGSTQLAVRSASFDLFPGQRMALVGQSGSGKSTLALAVTGLLGSGTGLDVSIEAAELTFDGKPVPTRHAGSIPVRTPGVAMVFQDAMTALDPVRTVGRQLSTVLRGAGITGSTARTTAREWLEKVGLHDIDRVLASRPDELSGGMRQRVMIAVALAGKPRLLVADEPTSALDASVAKSAMKLLEDLAASEGVALLVISHDILLCLDHADVVGVMFDGELVETGPAQGLKENAQHPYTRALIECVPTMDDRNRDRLPTLVDVMGAAAPTL